MFGEIAHQYIQNVAIQRKVHEQKLPAVLIETIVVNITVIRIYFARQCSPFTLRLTGGCL